VIGDPLGQFEVEHAHALAALAGLETAALGLRAGEPAAPHLARAQDVHAFLTSAVREHNEREERALFPLLGDAAPTAVFVDEHAELRSLERKLAAALHDADPDRAADLALDLVALLRAHIARENDVLFPLARAVLGPAGLAEVGHRLEP
jgi:hemerythrin-like domain-containing protein